MANTAEEIIKNSIKELKQVQSKARRDEVRKMLDYYTGTSTSEYIRRYFNADSFREIPHYESNFTKKFINKISRIYTVGANRNVNKSYDSLTDVKDVRMKHVERMTRLIGSIALRVMWVTDENGENPMFDYRPIYYFDPYFHSDPFEPTAIVYPMNAPVNDPGATEKLKYCYWDSEIFRIVDENGHILQDTKHGYGVLPFVFLHRENQIDSFYVEGSQDIVSANEHVNIAMTEMQLGLRFQMFGQPWTNLDSDKPVARTGSDEILMLGDGGQFNIASPQGSINSVIENIKFQIEMVAQNHHLWVTWAEQGGEVPSGISLMIKDLERHEDFIDDIELWRLYEKQIYKKEQAIAEFNFTSLPDKFAVDFNEVEYPTTAQDKIMLDEFSLKHNLITEAKMMVRDNKDLSIEQAQKIIGDNKEVNEQSVNRGLFSTLRQET
jgi:hypothetical protein